MDRSTEDDLEERAAIIADGCNISQAAATVKAKTQAAEEARRKLGSAGWPQTESALLRYVT